MYAQMIQTLNPVIDDYEGASKRSSTIIPRPICSTNSPVLDPLAPRLLSFFGTDRSRYEAAGTSTVFLESLR
jgi:hypothetical protein